MAWRLREFYVSLYNGLEHQFLEVALYLVINLVGQTQTTIVHGKQESLDFQHWVQLVFDNLDCVEQFADTLKCKVLALHGDDNRVGRSKGVNGDEAQRW